MRVYSIRRWNALYENSRSREVEHLRWVPIPIHHDGEKYAQLMQHAKADKIFSAWILILQVAAQCTPRGRLRRADGTPHTPQSLSLKTRAPLAWFELAIPYIHDELQWIESEPFAEQIGSTSADARHPSAEEGKGREGKEGKEAQAVLPFQGEAFGRAWDGWTAHRKAMRKPLTPAAITLTFKKLARIPEREAISWIENAIEMGWQGIYEPRKNGGTFQPQRSKIESIN